MNQRTAGWLACLLLWVGCTLVWTDTARAQTADPATEPANHLESLSMEVTVDTLLASMTVADRIGQLFRDSVPGILHPPIRCHRAAGARLSGGGRGTDGAEQQH